MPPAVGGALPHATHPTGGAIFASLCLPLHRDLRFAHQPDPQGPTCRTRPSSPPRAAACRPHARARPPRASSRRAAPEGVLASPSAGSMVSRRGASLPGARAGHRPFHRQAKRRAQKPGRSQRAISSSVRPVITSPPPPPIFVEHPARPTWGRCLIVAERDGKVQLQCQDGQEHAIALSRTSTSSSR